MKFPRVAIIGCGAVVEQLHLPAFKKIGLSPSVFIDIDLKRAEGLANSFDAKYSDDHNKVLQDFDAALISVPHSLHAPISIDLMKNKKHVLIEKPMATSLQECEEMIECANQNDVKLSVGLFRRYRTSYSWIREFLKSGGLGLIKSFECFEGNVYRWPVTTNSFWKKEKAGGGVLIDTGAHTLDLLLWWLGDLKVISYKDDSYSGVEADCIIELSTDSGATGTVQLSRTRKLSNTAIIEGTNGNIEISLGSNNISADPVTLLNGTYNGKSLKKNHPQTISDLICDQLLNWISGVQDKQNIFVSGEDGLHSIKLIEQCYDTKEYWQFPWMQPNK